MPSILMDYAEVQFIFAEAAQRGLLTAGTGTAATYYYNGITASMEYYGISSAAIASYLAQPSVVYNAANGLQQIALQKWIALYAQGTEAWANQRRTGIPSLEVGPEATLAIIPNRLEYPQSEQSLNLSNYNAAVASQGPNDKTTKMWWQP
jgi:hypothetical protein